MRVAVFGGTGFVGGYLVDALIEEAISSNPEKVSEIQAGNEKLVNWLTGQVMKASKGKANPKQVTDSIRTKLLN